MKLYVIDGNSLLFRAYFATAYTGNLMKTKDGFPTNALFGFTNMMTKILSQLKDDDRICVSFDTGKKTFRHQRLEEYKAQRKPIDEDLKIQIPYARDLLKALGVFYYEVEGYEGDDVAGSVAKQFGSLNQIETIMYTSDKDYLQLIDDYISIGMTKKGLTDLEIYNKEKLFEKMELTPDQIKDYKGLMGDPSDNLKGIPGVGEKTAIKLLKEYGSLENIISSMENVNSKQAQKIRENKDLGLLCKEMATIIIDLALPFSIDDLKYEGYNYNELSSLYNKFEFFSLQKKLKPTSSSKEEIIEESIEVINVNHFNEIPFTKFIIMDQEKGNYHSSLINGFYFACENKVYYFPFEKARNDKDFILYIEDEKIKKSTFDFKALMGALSNFNIDVKGLGFDLLLAVYILDSNYSKDATSAYSYLGADVLKSSTNQASSLISDGSLYVNMAYYLEKLEPICLKKLKEIECLDLYNNIELPLCIVLGDMEKEGFPLNKEKLEEINSVYAQKLESLTSKIYDLVGYEFNIASPKQCANLLFEKLGLPSNKKESTSIEVLNSLIDAHPVVPLLIEHRKYSKIISTYSQGLLSYIQKDGKIHTLYNQALTQTGRLSSSEPNLQNISVRTEEGKAIRKAFFYEDSSYSMLSLDYSQIELRLLSAMAKCQDLIDTFNNDGDIHTETASTVFSIPKEEVTKELRRRAKAINFGIIYGISDWGLSEQISSSPAEAKKIITTFYEKYPSIKEYFKNVIAFTSENGYCKTLFNRRRYIEELKSDNFHMREFGKRAAMNAPLQGTAADLMKLCMVKVSNYLKENNLNTKIVLQIHDELIFKVPHEEESFILPAIKKIMEECVDVGVKLEVDGGFGKSWYDCK